MAGSFNFAQVVTIPVAALTGDNVVHRSTAMSWYAGPTLLDYLEAVDPETAIVDGPFRMPVQLVLRPTHEFRGYAGQILTGVVRPGDAVTLVAEKPDEITTEGGLDVKTNISIVRAAVARLREGNILASLFIDPDASQIEVAREVGAQQVELCTAAYAEATLGARGIHGEGAAKAAQELRRLREGAALAKQYGLHVAAGHGLTYRNVGAVSGISEITEFNIGHNIVARAVFVGIGKAVEEMRSAIKAGAKILSLRSEL
jgi:pyridoxine 5'-phosphate synthase PdxJ